MKTVHNRFNYALRNLRKKFNNARRVANFEPYLVDVENGHILLKHGDKILCDINTEADTVTVQDEGRRALAIRNKINKFLDISNMGVQVTMNHGDWVVTSEDLSTIIPYESGITVGRGCATVSTPKKKAKKAKKPKAKETKKATAKEETEAK